MGDVLLTLLSYRFTTTNEKIGYCIYDDMMKLSNYLVGKVKLQICKYINKIKYVC